jgi:DNA-binding transcriptional ArsR family regulator
MLDTVLQAIAEPNRREILRLLNRQELSAGEIATKFSITRPAVSQHLGVLEKAGLVKVRRAGTSRLYQICPEALAELKDFLAEFWDDRLVRLKELAEAEERSK